MEEIQGRPHDGRQHVYVWRQRGDHWPDHEELAETEEAARVVRAAKWFDDEVKVSGHVLCQNAYIIKTAKYQKRCFDQIEGIVAENKALTAEVDRLRLEAEKEAADKAAQEEHLLDLNRRLADKDREKKGRSNDPISCI